MQSFYNLNAIVESTKSSYDEFESTLKNSEIYQQTYLNLLLTAVIKFKNKSHQFRDYIELLTNYSRVTKKKSANINYIGYKDKISIFMHACALSNSENISFLLEKKQADLHILDPSGCNAAFYAISNKNIDESLQILCLLLEKCPSLINSRNFNHETLLHRAVQVGKINIMEFLIKHEISLNQKTKDKGNTAAHLCLELALNNQQTAIKMLQILDASKANFQQVNHQNKNVINLCIQSSVFISKKSWARFCEETTTEDPQNEQDKESFTSYSYSLQYEESVSEMDELRSVTNSQFVEADLFDQNIISNQQEEDSYSSENDDIDLFKHSEIINKNMEQLCQQIENLGKQSLNNYNQYKKIINQFIQMLQNLIIQFNLVVSLVGSFATGLWSKHSDIDINLISRHNDYVDFQQLIQKVYRKLKHQKQKFKIENLSLKKGSKVNNIHIQLSKTYYFGKVVDISIFHPKNSGYHYVQAISQELYFYPKIYSLFFVLRKLSDLFGLEGHSYGGLKTYTLFLMIRQIVIEYQQKNVAQILLEIFYYFGFEHEYQYYQHQETLIMRFNLYDPLNIKNNIGGKHIKAERMKNMFRACYYKLTSNIYSEIQLKNLFQISQLF